MWKTGRTGKSSIPLSNCLKKLNNNRSGKRRNTAAFTAFEGLQPIGMGVFPFAKLGFLDHSSDAEKTEGRPPDVNGFW
ncbi:MAG: hypothetical protein ACRESZ_05575 [Methylococcales bacterium]